MIIRVVVVCWGVYIVETLILGSYHMGPGYRMKAAA